MDGNDGPVWDKTSPVQVDPAWEEEPEPTTFAVHARWAAVAAVGAMVVGVAVGHQLTPTRTVTTAGPMVTVTASPVGLDPATQHPSPTPGTWTVTRTYTAKPIGSAATYTATHTVAVTVVRREVVAGPPRTVRVPGPVRVVVVRVTATVVGRRW